jgi:aminoglycoside phosphotransferase family enzyme
LKLLIGKQKGKAVEYGVKMLEIPQKFRMDYLIKVDKVSLKTIDRLTRILVNFHSSTRTNPRIKSFGTTLIKKKIDEMLHISWIKSIKYIKD